MRNKLTLITTLFALALFITACGTAVAQGEENKTRTLTVSGTAQASLSPDIAHISIGVQNQDEDAQVALSDNSARVQEVIDGLRALGVSERDIRTSNFNIYPSMQYNRDGEMTGIIYIVSNNVNVTLRSLDRIGQILNASVASGANQISGIQFDIADKEAALAEARKTAIDNAQAMAQELAAAAGVSLGPIQSLNVSGGGFPGPVYPPAFRGMESAAMDVPIAAGDINLTVEVSIVYESR
jgi:uncharacterized protein